MSDLSMATSEIEVVGSPLSNAQQPQGVAKKVNCVFDVHSASAYGDLEMIRKFVEVDGSSVHQPDGNGYYPLQWAALNNYPDISIYILEHGGEVDATDNLGQTALHWAAVTGSLEVAEILLKNGARVESTDNYGFRAVHMAAQYGQTAFLNHIVAKYHADFDALDNEGRSPLHWAAYKGFADTVRLLLFRDANQGKQDRGGCTPLHWAAINGNLEACTVLVHASTKKELSVKDKLGFTPFQLATDKGHRQVALFLANMQRAQSNQWRDKLFHGKFAATGFAPALFSIIIMCMFLFINSVLAAPNLPKVTATVGLWGWVAMFLTAVALVMLYRCSSKDPGYLQQSEGLAKSPDEVDALLSINLNNSAVWTGNWSQLCPTCKIIRPLRSKHCPICKRCVEQFDHHCPWISNCVGKCNKREFFIFVLLGALSSSLTAVVTFQRIWTALLTTQAKDGWVGFMFVQHSGIVIFLFFDLVILMAATTLTTVQTYQIAMNITTNEVANASRYEYLRGPDGRFRNPYNQGCQKNCADFVIQGFTDDTSAFRPLHQMVI